MRLYTKKIYKYNLNNRVIYSDLELIFKDNKLSRNISTELMILYSYLVNITKFRIFTFTISKINIELYNNSKSRKTIEKYFKILVSLGFLKLISYNRFLKNKSFKTLKSYMCFYVPMKFTNKPRLSELIHLYNENYFKFNEKENNFIDLLINSQKLTTLNYLNIKNVLNKSNFLRIHLSKIEKELIKENENNINDLINYRSTLTLSLNYLLPIYENNKILNEIELIDNEINNLKEINNNLINKTAY